MLPAYRASTAQRCQLAPRPDRLAACRHTTAPERRRADSGPLACLVTAPTPRGGSSGARRDASHFDFYGWGWLPVYSQQPWGGSFG